MSKKWNKIWWWKAILKKINEGNFNLNLLRIIINDKVNHSSFLSIQIENMNQIMIININKNLKLKKYNKIIEIEIIMKIKNSINKR